MNKKELENFIGKYNLDGSVETVMWGVDENNNLSVDIMTPERECIGLVKGHSDSIKNEISSKINNYEIGITQTSYLKKMLDVLDEEISFDVNKSKTEDEILSLFFKDNDTYVKFTTCEKGIITSPMKVKKMPDFQAELEITGDFIDRFIKSYNSLKYDQSGPTFAFVYDGETANIILDYAENINKNNISLNVNEIGNKKIEEKMVINFPGKGFMKALKNNKDFDDAVFKVSSEGLLYLQFQNDITLSEYFIVKTNE